MFSATTNVVSLKLTAHDYEAVKRPTVYAKLLDIFNLSIFSPFSQGVKAKYVMLHLKDISLSRYMCPF